MLLLNFFCTVGGVVLLYGGGMALLHGGVGVVGCVGFDGWLILCVL